MNLSRSKQGELAGRGRLAGALQAAQHQDGGAVLGEVEAIIDRAHEIDQLGVDELDDLLAGIEAAENVLADRLLGDPLDEGVGDVVVDVGVEEGGANLLQAVANVGVGEALAAQTLDGVCQAACNALEHVSPDGIATAKVNRPL